MDPKTRSKCVILKHDEENKLLEYFNAEDLPVEFGGTCSCEDGCLPPVPKHMVSPWSVNIQKINQDLVLTRHLNMLLLGRMLPECWGKKSL